MTTQKTIQIDVLPQSVESFVALSDEIAQTPQGGAVMMALALLLYAEGEEMGEQCLAATIDRERLGQGDRGYHGWQLRTANIQLIRSQIERQPYIPRSYIKGATPENGYQLPPAPYTFEFSYNPYSGDPESGTYKPFIVCSGARPRPVTVRRNQEGVWKAYEWSSLIVGVREPGQESTDDL